MTNRAHKWIELSNRLAECEEKANLYSFGLHFNNIKFSTWNSRAIKVRAMITRIESKLTEAEKDSIEDYYQCSDMF